MSEIVDLPADVQQREQQDAAIDAAAGGAGPSDSAPDSAPSGKRAGHDRQGKFTKGNVAALKHGRWSAAAAKALLPEQLETLTRLADHESSILIDLGGASELSTFEIDLVRRYQQLDAVAGFNAPRMLSARAAVRNQAVTVFMACIDRQLKIVALLGLRRRTKNITDLDNISDYLAATRDQPEDTSR